MLQVILTKIALVLLAIIVIGLIISFSKDNKKSYKVNDLYEDARTGRIYYLKGRKRIYYN